MTDERRKYLKQVAEDYGVREDAVFTIAELLGPEEDYDGLLSAVDDLDSSYDL